VAITAPFGVVFLLSVITSRQQPVATAVALPALAGLMWIVASLLSARLAVESAVRRTAGRVKSASTTAILVYFVLLIATRHCKGAGHAARLSGPAARSQATFEHTGARGFARASVAEARHGEFA
jgi:hypothetical protein